MLECGRPVQSQSAGAGRAEVPVATTVRVLPVLGTERSHFDTERGAHGIVHCTACVGMRERRQSFETFKPSEWRQAAVGPTPEPVRFILCASLPRLKRVSRSVDVAVR